MTPFFIYLVEPWGLLAAEAVAVLASGGLETP